MPELPIAPSKDGLMEMDANDMGKAKKKLKGQVSEWWYAK